MRFVKDCLEKEEAKGGDEEHKGLNRWQRRKRNWRRRLRKRPKWGGRKRLTKRKEQEELREDEGYVQEKEDWERRRNSNGIGATMRSTSKER